MRTLSIIFIFLFASVAFAADMPQVDLNGLIKEVKAYNGRTVVVFWAPWCPHCKKELQTIKDNPQFIKKNNLQVIGLTKARDKHLAEEYVEKEKLPFRFFIGTQEIYDKLQKIDAVPFTIVFDKNGEIHDSEYGRQGIEGLSLLLLD